MLDTTFLGAGGDAPSDTPSADAGVVPESVITPVSDAAPIVDPSAAPVTAEPVTPDEPVVAPTPDLQAPAEVAEPLDEEAELRKLADDPSTPKFARDKIKEAMAYAGKLKEAKSAIQTEFDNFKSQYDGKSPLDPVEIERLRVAEEKFYKLSSFTATPDEVLASLGETIAPQKLNQVKSQLVWNFLETPDGKPDFENLQTIVDRFSGYSGEGERVGAKDVINAIQALKRGTVKPHELHEFSTDAEYESYQRQTSLERQIEEQTQAAKANADYQERHTRQAVIQTAVQQIQGQFQPKVESLLDKFHLNYVPNEPKLATEFKQAVQQRIANTIQEHSTKSTSLSDVFKALNMLGEPTGARVDAIEQEVRGYVSSFPYQTALSRGLSEITSAVEKVIAEEAYRYKLLMSGYEQEVSKGQNAREIINLPNQTEVLTDYTAEQLAAMSANERRHHTLRQVSEQMRTIGKTPRLG